jgi:hypothetical protein
LITNKRAWGDAEWAGLGHLAQEFLNDLADDYAEHGKAFVRRLRTDHPQTYIKVLLLLSPLDECMYEQVFGVLTPDQRRAFFEEFLKMPQEEQAAAPAAAES